MEMIQVKNLVKQFGTFQAVKGISFSVQKGEILGFLGPNGAGKSTTMRTITCFYPPTSGSIKVAGYDVMEDSLEVRRRIGYMPESVPMYVDMGVVDYLDFAGQVKGLKKNKRKLNIEKVLTECGLQNMRHKYIKQLSKGYRQRVGLAQALINDPEVLILDEPTIGLDPRQIIEIRQLIKNLAGRRTVIISTHILPEVSMICQKVIIINEGKLVAADTPQNLTDQLEKSKEILLRVEGARDRVIELLKGVEGVINVDAREIKETGLKLPGETRDYVVKCEKKSALGSKLADTVVKNNMGLHQMQPIAMSLEDIFIKLVTKE